MKAYADSSFLVAVYWWGESESLKAIKWMQRATEALPFTPFHRHEVRTGLRLKVFRGVATAEERKAAFAEIESDLKDDILVHTPISWTEAFRRAEELADAHEERLGVRSSDLLHVGVALSLGVKEFLTFDSRQAAIAEAAGLKLLFKVKT